MDASELIERALQAGIFVSLDNGEISVMSAGKLSPEQSAILADMKTRKAEVVGALLRERYGDSPTSGIRAPHLAAREYR
ncbi:MAG TPA: hypothetical protein VKO18_17825 [Terriglobia bacterium]|nr:hypothetical protein [Terriglobia bacterium]